MSWDIFIQQFPKDVRRVAEIPDSFQPEPIGRRADVIARIQTALPAVDFSDTTWGILSGNGYEIELGLGDDDPLYSITLHVRGSDAVLPEITRILEALGLRAIDSWTGEFFDPSVAPHSLARWRSYIEDGA